jgi:ATP phosphoribosyltransferase
MSKLKIAVQKQGRLSEKSLQLLQNCGIKLSNGDRKLKAEARNYPVEVLFLRDDDIPQYVEQGVADVGILGANEVLEKNKNVEIVQKLGFAHCRMSLAIPMSEKYTNSSYFEGKKVATSYPNILSSFFNERKINVQIEEIGGSVEIATGIGLADGIFDIVSTGSTLLMNGLKEVEQVIQSEAVLIAHQKLNSEKTRILNQLTFRINAVHKAKEHRYILLNAPNDKIDEICQILPGMKAPTVLPLAQKGWSSLHSVVNEQDFWDIIDQLKAHGAEGILVAPIEKMII